MTERRWTNQQFSAAVGIYCNCGMALSTAGTSVARVYTDRGELQTVSVGSTDSESRTYDDDSRMLTSVFISDSCDLHATRSDTIGGELDAT